MNRLKTEQQNLVIIMLSLITILALVGSIVLTLFDKKAPESLVNLAFSSVGALGGIIATKDKQEKDDSSDSDKIVHAIGDAAVRTILAEAREAKEGK